MRLPMVICKSSGMRALRYIRKPVIPSGMAGFCFALLFFLSAGKNLQGPSCFLLDSWYNKIGPGFPGTDDWKNADKGGSYGEKIYWFGGAVSGGLPVV